MNRVNGKRALHRRERAQARVSPFQLLHDEAIRRVAQPRTAVLFQMRSIEAQRAHPRREVFRKFGRAMAGHDFGHDFLLHKTPRPIACRALVVREEVFDGVVIQRTHTVRFQNKFRIAADTRNYSGSCEKGIVKLPVFHVNPSSAIAFAVGCCPI